MAGDGVTEVRFVATDMDGGQLNIGWSAGAEPADLNESTLEDRQSMDSIHRQLRVLVSTISFWGAILLPALYLPLLLRGLESRAGLGLFLTLFGLHALALLGGRRHHE
jgi:hypothetical protein